jgi:enhanced entry protein EnhC
MYCASAYLFGVGVAKNEDMAKRYYIAAAKSGDGIAQFTLADYFLDSRHAENKKLGLIWLNKSVAQNNPAALTKLGEMYANGTMVSVDLARAKELIEMAVAQNYIPALYQMGVFLQQQKDFKSAKVWYLKAEEAHYIPAEIAIAELYTQVDSPFYNLNLGFIQMLKAAQSGSPKAQLALATMYKNGQGVEKNENLAKEWGNKAVETEKKLVSASSEVSAAQWLSNGKLDTLAANGYQLKGIFSDWHHPSALKENNYNQAPQLDVLTREEIYKPNFVMTDPNDIPISEYYDALASAMGNSNQKLVGVFPQYSLDQKVVNSTNEKERFKKIEGRALLGDPVAQFTLSQMYQDGVGVDKNIQEAIKYYELATAQQNLKAEYNLGLLYLEGKEVSPDYQKAMELLRDAAFKGNDYAQFSLATIYEHGYHNKTGELVIPPEPEQAMSMYFLASANDYGPAEYRLAEMLVREKKANTTDMTVAGKKKRNLMIKNLYQGAVSAGVAEAGLPLAFFNAMDKDSGKQAAAFDVAMKEAKEGNADAALLLGLLYDRGIATERNQSDALSWYQKASINPVSAFILGSYLSQGTGIGKDVDKGRLLLQQAADAGFSYAHLNLAVMQQQSNEPFLPELEKAMALENSTAGLLLADYYLSLASDDKQMQQARDIYKNFSEKGDKTAQLKLGYMFEQGLGGVVDPISAEKWYRESALQGQPIAQYLLGGLYRLGHLGNQPDYAEAKKWYSRAQTNYSPAATALGFIYDTVDDNYQQARASYQLAAEKHDPIGLLDLGLMYEKGKGVPVDDVKAKALYQEAADQGQRQSMVQLAGLYFNGVDGSRDDEKALYWYKKAADLGDRDALYQLGLLSETGVGVKLDSADALHYYQLASDKGNAKATLALARMYQYGLGVAKDSQQAEKFYKELATLNNAYAQYQLGAFYYDGVAGKSLQQEGRKLLQQAQDNGSQQARTVLQWLDTQNAETKSFIEPLILAQTPEVVQPVDLMYMNALNEWNRGDELTSRSILDRILVQFPDFIPAKKAYDQLNPKSSSDIIS